MNSDLDDLFAGGAPRQLQRGEAAILQGDAVAAMYLVTSGQVILHRPTPDGGNLILQRAGAGDVLAEASAYTPRYHCAAYAQGAAQLLGVPIATFHARLAARPDLAAIWAAHLAHAVQSARLRAEIRSLRGVEARLDAWLAAGRALPDKGHMQDLAAEIGVTREALYRALSRRRT